MSEYYGVSRVRGGRRRRAGRRTPTSQIDLHELLGRRFEFTDGSGPDCTLVAGDPKERTVRLHSADGKAQTVPMKLFCEALTKGALVESMKPSFVNEGSGQRAESAHRKRAKQPRDYRGDRE